MAMPLHALDALCRDLLDAGYAVRPSPAEEGRAGALVISARATHRSVAVWCERRADYLDELCFMVREGDGDPTPVATVSNLRCAVAAVGGWLGMPPLRSPLRVVEGSGAR